MKIHRSLIAIVMALAMMAPAIASAAKPNSSSLSVPITQVLPSGGTLTSGTPFTGGSFVGQLAINEFKVVDGQLNALGTLTGQILDTTGAVLGTVATAVAVPITGNGSCSILHLTLGPLDLNLLGLQVHLNQVVLDITAQAGPGNLLGNLLCSVADLFNGGALSHLANVLNQLIGAL
jgi:hypothetical protein